MAAMPTVTREQIALRVGRSPWTLRRWERDGILPKADADGYYPVSLLCGHSWDEVSHVILQGRSVFFAMKDGTYVWTASRATEMPEKQQE